jgi:hypothetical protein
MSATPASAPTTKLELFLVELNHQETFAGLTSIDILASDTVETAKGRSVVLCAL